MSKTDLFQTIQFIITQFSSIWPIDMTLLDATSPGAIAMKGYSAFTKTPALLEPYHYIV